MDSKLPSKKSTRGEEIAAKTLRETNIQNFLSTKIDFQLRPGTKTFFIYLKVVLFIRKYI